MQFDKRLASNMVMLDDKPLGRFVIEICGDRVVKYYPLIAELPFTEWIETALELYTDTDGAIRLKK